MSLLSDLTAALLLGLVCSYIGSLPPAMINMTAAETSIRLGMRPAMRVALGASLVEILQALIAVGFAQFFARQPLLNRVFSIASAVVFGVLCVYYLAVARQSAAAGQRELRQGIGYGMLISALNMLAIPFWMFYGTYLQVQGWLDPGHPSLVAFSIGTGLGTYLLLYTYAYLGQRIVRRSGLVSRLMNRVMALLFGVLLLLQVVQLLRDAA
ncbi:MAG: LysE family transporter [Bacteroidia bacterium]|nr:LysE family transporter [Bacteroidia bacterium]